MRYQVFDPATDEILSEQDSLSEAKIDAVFFADESNIGIRDLEAAPGAVDLWSVSPDGTVKEITIKHDDPKREEGK